MLAVLCQDAAALGQRTQQGTATSRHCLVGGSGAGVCMQLQGHRSNGSNAAKAATRKQILKGNAAGTQQGCKRKPAAMTGGRSSNPTGHQIRQGCSRNATKTAGVAAGIRQGCSRDAARTTGAIHKGSSAGTQQGCNSNAAKTTGGRSRNPARTQEIGRVMTEMQRKRQELQEECSRAETGTRRERLGPQQICRGSAAGIQQGCNRNASETTGGAAGTQKEISRLAAATRQK